MKLPMRQDKKRNQALDAFASVAKTWSEWRLAERAATSVATGTKKASKATKKASKATAKARKRAAKAAGRSGPSRTKNALKSRPLKIAGAAAVVGGVGAAVSKKLKGGGTAEPLYTPPPAPGTAQPTAVEVGGLDATDSAVAASEKAATAATAPPPAGTEPSIPDTDVDATADTTGDDEVEDAMDVHSSSEEDAGADIPGDDAGKG
ncbi:MAG TPA: hypothetical protein VGR11_03160 [Solirubrobacteraceae bacterium]|nr:hypothetical protein [Solirubrobacteraceae bacterium]